MKTVFLPVFLVALDPVLLWVPPLPPLPESLRLLEPPMNRVGQIWRRVAALRVAFSACVVPLDSSEPARFSSSPLTPAVTYPVLPMYKLDRDG